ncbi:MAG TPA: M20/M25/M40 family metallo-hydrolase [Verrucomicrobiae bacterium]|nr:M20/M25/M40 family metallo-hydrolase [Verrucomicrobiae bacterium]
MTKTEKLVRELIALPSVNPAFLPANDAHAGENRVAEFIAAIATRAGLEVEFRPVYPTRSNLLATYTPSGKPKRKVLLAPHMDTVGAPGAVFTPQLKGNRLYGRGACDTKGSIAVMLSALLELTESPERPSQTEIVFAGLVDEESLQAGSRALAASKFKADFAIVGEPTRCKVVTAHKGAVWLKLETHGKAAHGAKPELGRNAVYEMARVCTLLETQYTAQLLKRRHALLEHGTINVGAIRAGQQPNIVPAHCSALIDRRTLPGETNASVVRELRTLFGAHGLSPTFSSIHPHPCPALETDRAHPMVQQFMTHARQRSPEGVTFFSDAAVLAAGGIPSVLFGPGDIAQAHTPDEWIDVAQLEQGKTALLKFLQSLE